MTGTVDLFCGDIRTSHVAHQYITLRTVNWKHTGV